MCRERLPENPRGIHIDHIMPVSKGGTDDWETFEPFVQAAT